MSSAVSAEPKPPVNYVFVDYENVHELDLALIGSKTVYFTLLLGALQTKLDAALVEKLIEHAAAVQLVRLSSTRKNALDFTLAYYMGKAVQADPNAYFHIVSKDTGFDPLVEHLGSRHIRARRHNDFTTLTLGAPPKAEEPAKMVAQPKNTGPNLLSEVVEHLRTHPKNRPKTRKTLASHLKAHLGKAAADTQAVAELIKQLIQKGHVKMGDKEAVTYAF